MFMVSCSWTSFVVLTCTLCLLRLDQHTPTSVATMHCTTVDYCLLSSWDTHLVMSCQTIEHYLLNFPNYLPLSVHLDLLSRLNPILVFPSLYTNNLQTRNLMQWCYLFNSRSHPQTHVHQQGWEPNTWVFWPWKAFDSTKYPTLLKHLSEIKINGKCWYLSKNWYTKSSNVIKLDHSYSSSFPVQCRVK